jgi:hypothetical protein
MQVPIADSFTFEANPPLVFSYFSGFPGKIKKTSALAGEFDGNIVRTIGMKCGDLSSQHPQSGAAALT